MSRKYIGITVLDALRGGISTHNFKKNHFALEKTSMPLDLALSGKSIFGRPKKSIFIALIVAGTILRSTIGGILIIAGAFFGLAAGLSYLNSFGYIAKDIKAFIEKHLQDYANAINIQNQPEERTDSLETEV